jgi:hypothetical protein
VGLGTTVHLVPSKCSMSVCSVDPTGADPTAHTSRDEVADTASSVPVDENAPATALQARPFQWRRIGMSPPVEDPTPTAQTSSAETALTPDRLETAPRLGLGTTVHTWPSKCSIRVTRRLPDADRESPTAHTSLGELALTAARDEWVPGGLGTVTTCHEADTAAGAVGAADATARPITP